MKFNFFARSRLFVKTKYFWLLSSLSSHWKYISKGALILFVAFIAFGANISSILGWLGIKPSATLPSFHYSLSCNNNGINNPFGARVEELEQLFNFIRFIKDHDGQFVFVSFELLNDGAYACARLDESDFIVPDYDIFAGMITIGEYSANQYLTDNLEYVRAVSPESILQIDAFWPDVFGVGQTIMLPQVREFYGLSDYDTGDQYCIRCFSGRFEANYLSVPARQVYSLTVPIPIR